MNPTDRKQRMDRFFAAHRESGLPVTTQRRAVFEVILDRADHPTAEQLYRAVSGQLPQISRMTVHRILRIRFTRSGGQDLPPGFGGALRPQAPPASPPCLLGLRAHY